MKKPSSTMPSAAMAFLEGRHDRRHIEDASGQVIKNLTTPKLRDRIKRAAVKERLEREAEAATWIEQVKKRRSQVAP